MHNSYTRSGIIVELYSLTSICGYLWAFFLSMHSVSQILTDRLWPSDPVLKARNILFLPGIPPQNNFTGFVESLSYFGFRNLLTIFYHSKSSSCCPLQFTVKRRKLFLRLTSNTLSDSIYTYNKNEYGELSNAEVS